MRRIWLSACLIVALSVPTVLRGSDSPTPDSENSHNLVRKAWEASRSGEVGDAIDLCRQSGDAARVVGDREGVLESLRCEAVVRIDEEQYEDARRLLRLEVEMSAEIGRPSKDLFSAISLIATTYESELDRRSALHEWETAILVGRDLPDLWLLTPLQRVGYAAFEASETKRAERLIDRYVTAYRKLFSAEALAAINPWLAAYYVKSERIDEAREIYKMRIAYYRKFEDKHSELANAVAEYEAFLAEQDGVDR
jgi:tetratricopeptide (TPR) repeat protein